MNTEQLSILRLIRGKGIGPATFYKLLDYYGSAEKAVEAAESGQVKAAVAPLNVVQEELKALQKRGAQMVFYTEAHYPAALKMLADAPPRADVFGQCGVAAAKASGARGFTQCQRPRVQVYAKTCGGTF